MKLHPCVSGFLSITFLKRLVTFVDKNGQVTKVDKSWGYKLDNLGKLRIVLHHSSLPYTV